MSVKNIRFDGKNINKSHFYKSSYGKKAHLNALLGIMIMMTLDHYVKSFLT